jgi:FkbM family methyltransferase
MALFSIRRTLRSWFIKKRDLKITKQLEIILCESGISLVDIGAAGGLQDRWKPFARFVDLVAVEPDPRAEESIERLVSTSLRSLHRVNSPLASTNREIDFYLCKHPRQSSVLKPNSKHFAKYNDGHKWNVEKVEKMSAITLDSALASKIQPDFLKLDTQGSELDILHGSTATLQNCLGVEVEVEFREIYKSQPLFGDLSEFLLENEFDFIDFVAFGKWERSRPDGLRTFLGELIHADALFLRSPESVVDLAKKQNDQVLIRRYLALLFIYMRSDMMRATLKLAFEQSLVDELAAKELREIADKIDTRLHKFQSRLNILSSITGWTDSELRFNVVT